MVLILSNNKFKIFYQNFRTWPNRYFQRNLTKIQKKSKIKKKSRKFKKFHKNQKKIKKIKKSRYFIRELKKIQGTKKMNKKREMRILFIVGLGNNDG